MADSLEAGSLTPGRLLDLMNQGYIMLKGVEFFVLDEINRMLDIGFVKDMRRIVAALPQKHQSLFFSATMSRRQASLQKSFSQIPYASRPPPRPAPSSASRRASSSWIRTTSFRYCRGSLEMKTWNAS